MIQHSFEVPSISKSSSISECNVDEFYLSTSSSCGKSITESKSIQRNLSWKKHTKSPVKSSKCVVGLQFVSSKEDSSTEPTEVETLNNDTIRVALRFRPLLNQAGKGRCSCWRVVPEHQTVIQMTKLGSPVKGKTNTFVFDEVFDGTSTNDEIYCGIAKSIVHSVLDGIHGTIFAYGQTSSGKTYTMQGNKLNTPTSTKLNSTNMTTNNQYEEEEEEVPSPPPKNKNGQEGLIQLAVQDIFDTIKKQQHSREYLVRVSYIEVYNEEVRDLLDPAAGTIAVREHPTTGCYTENSEKIVHDSESTLKALRFGEANRHVGHTNMNEQSSRSHSIFRLAIESRKRLHYPSALHSFEHLSEQDDDLSTCSSSSSSSSNSLEEEETRQEKDQQNNKHHDDNDDAFVRSSCMNFVDLAGSESVRYTGCESQRVKEAGNINRSLLALSKVLASLGNGTSNAHINYRDSKLTRILRPSIEVNARVLFVCCATPADQFVEETRSTLQFATRAKKIKIQVQVNQVVDEKLLLIQLKKEIALLKHQLVASKKNWIHEKQQLYEQIAFLQNEKQQQLIHSPPIKKNLENIVDVEEIVQKIVQKIVEEIVIEEDDYFVKQAIQIMENNDDLQHLEIQEEDYEPQQPPQQQQLVSTTWIDEATTTTTTATITTTTTTEKMNENSKCNCEKKMEKFSIIENPFTKIVLDHGKSKEMMINQNSQAQEQVQKQQQPGGDYKNGGPVETKIDVRQWIASVKWIVNQTKLLDCLILVLCVTLIVLVE